MGRSTKKGPYVDERLEKRVEELNRQRQKKVLKTWSRRSTIVPEFVGTRWPCTTAGSSFRCT
jgi:Ribosomal protein S19